MRSDYEKNRFTPIAYVRDHIFDLGLYAAFLIVLDLMGMAFGVGWQALLFVDTVLVFCVGAILLHQYRRQRRFFFEAPEIAHTISDPDAIISLLPDAETLEARVACSALNETVRASEQERRQLREEARARREYMELWVHEVKTPIAASMLVLNNMHDEGAAKLKREVERVSSCVDQALYYARADSLASDYFIREVPLAKVVSDACKANMRLLTHRGVSVCVEIDDAISVLADRTWIEFVVSQIVSNAAKYDATTIRFMATEEGEGAFGRTILEIADDGCGIPAEDVPRVFERAFTGSVGRAHGSATGMGLYLVATMCARMGLSVELASEEGTGTRVMIGFPHDRRRFEYSV